MDVSTIKQGQRIIFNGYSEAPGEGEDQLEAGQSYEVERVIPEDNALIVRAPNPDFNPKKKASDSNPEFLSLDVFGEEVSEVEGNDEEEAPKAKAPAKAAAKTKAAEPKAEAKTEAKAPAKAAAKPAAKAKEETKPAAKAKAPAKAAAAKGKALAAPAEDEVEDPYADLTEDQEDQEILGLVSEAEDVLELAKEIAAESSALEYKMGGILFHIRKDGAYKELDDRYNEKGGFNLYLLEQLNIEYRKAMYLVDIYYKWNKFGLEATKVASIGWAKAAKIAAVMTEDNADELLELAETNTVADLVDNIKTNYKEVGGAKGERKKMTTFKFRLFEDSATAVEEVLQQVASSMGFKKIDEAFEHIIMEWATEHPQAAPSTAAVAPNARATGKTKAAAKVKN